MQHTPNDKRPGFQTRSLHQGYDATQHLGAVSPPIFMTSTFAFDEVGEAAAVFSGESGRFVYGRQHNPTQELLEKRLADLENAEAGLVTGSGMGAISSTLLTLLAAGDELIVHHTMYSTARALVSEGLPRLGIQVTEVDLSQPEALAQALSDRTRIVYFESPVNPTSELLDIRAISDIAHQREGVRVLVDSTFASPALQRPLEHGADLVVHSLTKYINGHGDLLGGAVLGDQATLQRIRSIGLKYMTGSTLSPMLCFLVLRGLKTLTLRMRQHGESALRIARMLEAHPAVRVVRYPFLESSPDAALAKRQMAHGSGMLSFELHAGAEGAVAAINRLRLISCAISLGDTESLITHPGSLLQARRKLHPEETQRASVNMDLIRLSVGLEDPEDLIADLHQALDPLVERPR
ncbi:MULTISPECIES: aminotransferase class I/II-fold pyridoxal phosphate-dependent enzyme [unclassified Variovorax]|uniref:trans-sulfuration enzyme family protein n=1 Tax=unclassified Variovorax TaxID=663243 RepID=UPI0025778A06|nr:MULTISPECIES: aminotransferase class I/II-fold pyridoxal phosphate-dependent enzyme [unclassified Variovorax]MDM0087238.1 aminotransferase class I/II-fold pyridoxal phosphate-dependent enzyme [Variovorax sp. J22G40]MDM0144505.1 aminotransferase class I/II-fold pyridoxal phosphate-dependent enzyme [Variovorax sp. J2P1-31]